MVEVAGHRPPEAIRPARRHAPDRHRDLDDLLLVEDHPKRVLENPLQMWMRIGDRLPPLLSVDVRVNRVALNRPWPDDRDLDHQIVEAVGPRAGKRLHLRAGLDLEHADGVGGAAHLEHLWVVERQLVEVWPNTVSVFDQLERFGDDRERAQPEHVHLDQAKVLDIVLVELNDPPPLHRRRFDRHDIDERLSRDQHAAVVDREVTRKIDHLPAQLEELLPALRPQLRWWYGARHRILDVFGDCLLYTS